VVRGAARQRVRVWGARNGANLTTSGALRPLRRPPDGVNRTLRACGV